MKRKQKELLIDHKNKKIIMTCKFAKRQTDTDSAEYAKLQAVHREFPTYDIITKSIKKKENKESYKGLTYEYMRRYISARGKDSDMEEYQQQKFLSECHTVRYPAIKQWFLNKYPEVMQFGAKEELIDTPTKTA